MRLRNLHHGFQGIALVATLGGLAQAVSAQSATADTPGVHRLSDAERDRILDGGSEAAVDAAQAQALAGGGIHGEVSAMIGTNGARGVAGSALIPLGQNGSAIVSFENSRFGGIRPR